MSAAKSRTAAGAGTGHNASEPVDGLPHLALSPARGISDAAFADLIEAWDADPVRQDIEVLISLKCSGRVFRIGDRETVIVLLKAEQARRRQARAAAP